MTFRLSNVEQTSTFPNEMIHIMPRCIVHLHGHQNNMVPLIKLLYLWILAMVLSFTTTPTGQLMTFIIIVSHGGLVTTTLVTET